MSIATGTSPLQPEPKLLGQTVVVIGGSASIGVVGPAGIAALAVHLMTNAADTGATYDIDGGQRFVEEWAHAGRDASLHGFSLPSIWFRNKAWRAEAD